MPSSIMRMLKSIPKYQVESCELTKLGVSVTENVHVARQLDHWVLNFVIEGEMDIVTDGHHHLVQPGEFYLFPPNIPHRGLKSCWRHVVIFHFHATASEAKGEAMHPVLPLFGKLPVEINYKNLHSYLHRAHILELMDGQELSRQLMAIIGQLSTACKSNEAQHDPRLNLAHAVMELLAADYPKQLDSKTIAQRIGYSYSHLDRVFRRHFQTSIHQQLIKIRMDAATELLLSGVSIQQTFEQVGYKDYYHFMKAYKKAKGVSPGSVAGGHVIR